MKIVHCIPMLDTCQHVLDRDGACPCGPVLHGPNIYIHNAFDGRDQEAKLHDRGWTLAPAEPFTIESAPVTTADQRPSLWARALKYTTSQLNIKSYFKKP